MGLNLWSKNIMCVVCWGQGDARCTVDPLPWLGVPWAEASTKHVASGRGFLGVGGVAFYLQAGLVGITVLMRAYVRLPARHI